MTSCGANKLVSASQSRVGASTLDAGGKPLTLISPGQGQVFSYITSRSERYTGAPSIDDAGLLMAVAAAFTEDTEGLNVCGYQVVDGEVIKGYDDVTATGHALIIGGKVKIFPKDRLNQSVKEAQAKKGFLFEQCLIVEDGRPHVERIPLALRQRNPRIIFRALCIMRDGSAVVAQTGEEMYCDEFVNALVAAGASQALYLDMGTWAWGWYRDADGTHELSPRFDNTRFQTNWLIIRNCIKT